MHNMLTLAGADRLKAKLQILKTQDLARANAEMIRAREEGKLEENEAYLHAQEQCRMLEKRIGEIAEVLDTYSIFEGPASSDSIGFGSTAVIEDCDTNKRRTVTLVGEPEADINIGCVSITSPLGEALIGASAGDVVELVIPKGTTSYEVISVSA